MCHRPGPRLLDAYWGGPHAGGVFSVGSAEEVVAILRTAATDAPDPRLTEVLAAFRRQWLAIAHERYAGLGDELEDAVQIALGKLVRRERLDQLSDPTRIAAWGRSLFVNAVIDVGRDRRRRHRRYGVLGSAADDPEDALRERLAVEAPTPEELASHRERLAIVERCIAGLEVGRLRFVEALPEREIAARLGLTRAAVAGQLKRLRKLLRAALEGRG